MSKVAIYNWKKEKVGEVDLPADVFAAPVRKDLLHTVVKWQLAKRRQGTHSTKTRGMVSGGGKKPFKQKGTGEARQGSSRSPLHPGGGIIFGPTPRSYEYTLPKKVKKSALTSALSYLVSKGSFFVVEDMKSTEGKTKEVANRLNHFGLNRAVLLDASLDEKFQRATRNLPKFVYQSTDGMNVYDLLKYDSAVVSKASLDKIVQRCRSLESAAE
jgi:large subunit ribosomal protein L4